jgi:hypothetical protein
VRKKHWKVLKPASRVAHTTLQSRITIAIEREEIEHQKFLDTQVVPTRLQVELDQVDAKCKEMEVDLATKCQAAKDKKAVVVEAN